MLYIYCFLLHFCKSCTHVHGARSGSMTLPKKGICSTPREDEDRVCWVLCSVASSRHGLVCCFLVVTTPGVQNRRSYGRSRGDTIPVFSAELLASCVSGRRTRRSVMFWPQSLSRPTAVDSVFRFPPLCFVYTCYAPLLEVFFRSVRLPERCALGHDFTQPLWSGLSCVLALWFFLTWVGVGRFLLCCVGVGEGWRPFLDFCSD